MSGGRSLAAAFVCAGGILAADRLQAGRWGLVSAVAAIALLGVAWLLHRRLPEPRVSELLPRLGKAAGACLLAGLFLTGFSAHALKIAALERSPLRAFSGRTVEVEGTASGDSRQSGRALRVVLSDLEIDSAQVDGKLLLRYFGSRKQYWHGDRITATARIRTLDRGDSFDLISLRRGIVVEATAGTPTLVGETANLFMRSANAMRRQLSKAALESLGPRTGGLLMGLLIGDESSISEEDKDRLRKSGLSHLTAVSGANVAMVLGTAFFLLRLVGVPRKGRVAACLLVLAFFVAVTRWEPSVLRASTMAGIALLAFVAGRGSDGLHALGISFLVLEAVDTAILWSIGFQLSFAATLGILLVSEPLAGKMKRIPRGVREVLAVSIAAQALVTPLVAFHFGRMNPLAVPANLVSFPAVFPATVLGLLGGFLEGLVHSAGALTLEVAGLFVSVILWTARVVSSVGWSDVEVSPWGPAEVLIFYLLLAAAVVLLKGRPRAAAFPAIAGVLLLGAGSLAGAPSMPPEGLLRITFFDVGQGDAALVESPGGARVLFDGGARGAGVEKDLASRGVRRLDLAVVSHAHFDHAAGLSDVISRVQVDEVLVPGTADPLERELTSLPPPDRVAEAGQRLSVGDLTIEVLAPFPDQVGLARIPGTEGEGSALNDASVVVRIEWGSHCVLFTGDIELDGQQSLVSRKPSGVDCTVMKAPHHGSPKLSSEFLDAVDPEWVVVSVGRNDYGHPAPSALRLFSRAGARVLRTDRMGDIEILLARDGRVSAG